MLGSWRRSLQLAYFNHRLISRVNQTKQVNWLLIDLGLRHVALEKINEELDRMLIGFNRMFKYKSVKQATLGYFRMLDIEKESDVYHPTIHILLPTIKSYYQGRYYIKQDEWLSLWHRALDLNPDYNHLSVSVNGLNGKCSQQDMISKMEQGLDRLLNEPDRIVTGSDGQLAARRLVGYSRLLKEEMDNLYPGIEFNLNKYDTDDAVANCAFDVMAQWRPGVRVQEIHPLHCNSCL
ncbi:protein rep [Paenibacillus marinisediminis]